MTMKFSGTLILAVGLLLAVPSALAGVTDVNAEVCKNEDGTGTANACSGVSNSYNEDSSTTQEQQVYTAYDTSGGDVEQTQMNSQGGNCNHNVIQLNLVIGSGNSVCSNYQDNSMDADASGGHVYASSDAGSLS